MIYPEDFVDFESMIATEKSDIEECFALTVELVRLTENMDLNPKLAPEVAKFYINNPEMGKVLFIRHKPTKEIIAFMIANFHYSLKWDEMVSRETSLIVKKEYRGKGLTNIFWVNIDMLQELMKYYRNDWSYVAEDNHNAIKIYNHWGNQMNPNLKIQSMDLLLRKDPQTKTTVSLQENILFFESKFDSFGFKQGLGFEVVELSKIHLEGISRKKDGLVNDINTHFDRFSMKGLRVVIDNPAQAGCYTILYKGQVFGIVTLMKYYLLSRNGFDIWITGIYFDQKVAQSIHSDANIYIIQALQKFLVEYSRQISSDTNQPICKIFK